jgi:hypothetical protein
VSFELDYSDMRRRKAKMKRYRAAVIESVPRESLKQVLETSIEFLAIVTTDGLRGFLTALT